MVEHALKILRCKHVCQTIFQHFAFGIEKPNHSRQQRPDLLCQVKTETYTFLQLLLIQVTGISLYSVKTSENQRVQKQSSGIKWVKYAHIQVFISHVKNHINNQKSAFLWSVFSICRLHGRIYQPFPIHSSFQSVVENIMTRKIPLPCDILLENEPFVYKLLTDLLYQQKVNQFKPSSWYSCSLLPFLYSGDLSNFFHWNSCGLVLI